MKLYKECEELSEILFEEANQMVRKERLIIEKLLQENRELRNQIK
jgi:hypothetical protein